MKLMNLAISLSILMALIFPALLLSPFVYASDLDGPSTTFSSPINFCDVKAQESMKELNTLTLNKTNQINKIKAEINNLNSTQNLTNGLLKIKGEFKSSAIAIANQQPIDNKNIANNLDDFKKLLRTSLTLSAVHLITKSEKNHPETKTINQLCEDSTNAKTTLCDYINHKSSLDQSEEIQTLNKTVNNVYQALDNNSNPAKTKNDLEALYNTIPTPIAPDDVLKDLLSRSPKLSSMLENSGDKNIILDCLSNNNEEKENTSCKKLITDPNARKNVMAIVTSEMGDIQKELSNKKMQDFFTNLDSTSNLEQENLNKEKLTSDAIERLDKAINDTGNLAALEKMKQYVAQKFLRTCPDAQEKLVSSNINCQLLVDDNRITGLPGTSEKIDQLNVKLSGIIGKLKTSNSISTNKGELGPFSKHELAIYKNYCQNITMEKIITSVCKDIYAEADKISNVKEAAEWDSFNEKYWVEYSSSSAKGYNVYEKKSNSRIFGEALVQNLGRIVPIWLGNFQLSNQIDMMTNQALYQQQMMFMTNSSSPWMNSPYFTGNYYPTSTPNLTPMGYNFAK